MTSPEYWTRDRIERILRSHIENCAFVRSQPSLVKMDYFVGIHQEAKVRRDRHKAQKKREEIVQQEARDPREREKNERAQFLENFTGWLIADGKVLGDDCTAYKTADYDDYFNKIDMVIEWRGKGEGDLIRVGVDMTLGTPEEEDRKHQETLDHIRKANELMPVEYFRHKTHDGNVVLADIRMPRAARAISQKAVTLFWNNLVEIGLNLARTDLTLIDPENELPQRILKAQNAKTFVHLILSKMPAQIIDQKREFHVKRNPTHDAELDRLIQKIKEYPDPTI